MTRSQTFAALVALASLAACDKDRVQQLTATAPSARVKFFNFGVNAPSVNFYANDTKLTAILSASGAESNLGTAVGGVGAGGFYSGVAAGQYNLNARITAATDNGVQIASVSAALADGKAYSFYISGAYDGVAKKAEAFVVEDTFADTLIFSVAQVRFVNAIPNAPALVVYAKNTATGVELPLGGAVAYKAGGTFTPLVDGVYDLSARTPGSATNVFTRTGVSFSYGRVYTVAARGDYTVTSTTATNRPQFDNTANR